jgi:two-component system sensor histidine kinase PilS (NtrC family)
VRGVEGQRRRFTYFLFARLVLFVALTALILALQWQRDDQDEREFYTRFVIASSYFATFLGSLALRRAQRLETVVRAQVAFDLVLAGVVVILTGGLQSSFVFLYFVPIMGAATLGDRRLTWLATSTCTLLHAGVSSLQLFEWLELVDEGGRIVQVGLPDLPTLMIPLAGMPVIALLVGYQNFQLHDSLAENVKLSALNQNIVRSLSSGLLTIDQNARVLTANPTAYELLGLSGQLFGLDSEKLLPGLRAHLDDSGGFRNRFELELRRHDDGREIVVGLTSSALVDEQGRFLGHVVHFQDVTELRRMEKILRRNERLTAIGSLAASVAHEIRNPLAAISGCAELLEGTAQTEEDERLLRVIQRETTRLANIVNELLDVARPRTLARNELDLRRELGQLADSFRADRSHAGVELVLQLPDTPVIASVDGTQLGQVLWNLVRNAVQAMDGKGRLELGLAASDDEVRLSVRDHGHGIPPEHLERIFEPFFSTKQSGSGIGLALVHRIVEEHGGTIEVFSELGVGTHFLVRLPR